MFNRSRPWRARGPSFDSRAGSRRRGRCDDAQTVDQAASAQPDSIFDVSFSDDFAVAESAHPTDVPMATTPLPVARIDEAGLRAMAWRAREQDSRWAEPEVGSVQDDVLIVGLPRELFMPAKSDLLAIPRPRRSA